jgi:hypothetical protein
MHHRVPEGGAGTGRGLPPFANALRRHKFGQDEEVLLLTKSSAWPDEPAAAHLGAARGAAAQVLFRCETQVMFCVCYLLLQAAARKSRKRMAASQSERSSSTRTAG